MGRPRTLRARRIALVLAASLVVAPVAGAVSARQGTTTATLAARARHRRVAPLTGLPDPTAVSMRRSALTVKIDNTPMAHPQFGINEADVVYEEIVEGGITRLAAVFNSHLPPVIGPVRSVRRTDREIVFPLKGVFAFSGGAAYALASIATAPVKRYDEATAGSAMYRDPARYAPHNLLLNPVKLLAMAGRPTPPRPIFTYVAKDAPPRGAPVGSFTVNFPAGYAVHYAWDARTGSWDRSIFGAPDVTASGARVSPVNVIVMEVNYIGGVGAMGAEANLVGHGPAMVLSDGRLVRGSWFRSGVAKATAYRTSNGTVIAQRPGQTWVELLGPGETVNLYAPVG